MEIYFTISTLLMTGVVFAFGRNIQRQVDNLERRYENDYISVRENVRDLWKSINQLETVCGIGTETTTETNTVSPKAKQSPAQHKSTPVISPVYVSQLVQGLSKEKEFLRNSLKDITDSIIQVNNSFTNTVHEKMRYMSKIDVTCSSIENEMENVHKKQAVMLVHIERTRETLETEVDGLRLVINQALEAMQNSILNKPASCTDLAKAGVTSSGVYTLHYRMQPFTVYCLMNENGGYTFISPETYMNVDIKSLSNDNSHVVIRHRRTNGLQYETRIEQISRYKSRPLSVQYNAHTGYKRYC
ncbi:uncharacterized protein LOC123564196 [Mercenaria mercenaria]|uniref:uncharacterized protein LOC123564196 n=1 Tax=Mercenaria mercenaria TaxID=6596 RepID=UPI00234EE450|nr:uncharacterized protein LOC123564196 [Mercenaria mercenaria]